MRTILFRGKRADNGEWVEGYYTKKLCGEYINNQFMESEKDFIVTYFSSGGITSHEVIPDTIGQYTGLKDKNGKEIYEGDIIRIPDDYEEYGHNAGEVYEIYFAYGGFRMKPKYGKGARGYWLEDDNLFKIIGNIHDNPELLGGDDT